MFDDFSLEFAQAFTSQYKDPPPGATPTKISENYEEISGWLRRKPIRGMKKWEWRYFTLCQGKLKYFQYESDITPSGVFNFKQLTPTIETKKNKSFILEFHSCPHQFYYKAMSKEDRQQWLTVLALNINNYTQMNVINTSVPSKESFWKYERVSNLNFLYSANTGDLLLFQAKNMGAKIQRGIAGSSFDHVGMILCHASGKISVFEATAVNGVSLASWDDFFEYDWISLYDKIIYRKVEFERSNFLLDNLQNFIGATKGKKFGFTARKVVMKNEAKAGEENDFFCSELVASAYKAIGILPSDFDSSKVWPSNFEKDDGLPLINAKVGPLIEIDFDLEPNDIN